MRTGFRLLFVALLALAVPNAAAQSRLFFISQTNDQVGLGETRDFTPAGGWTFSGPSQGSYVTVSLWNPSDPQFLRWDLALRAPDGAVLAPGVYVVPGGDQGPDPASPQLMFDGERRSCGNVRGRFVVLEVEHTPAAGYTKLAVDFEQHCYGQAPGLFGQVRVNSSYPIDTTQNIPDVLAFPTTMDAAPGAYAVSASAAVSRIQVPVPISVSGGEYSIDNGPWTSVAGTVVNGQGVRLRLLTPAPNANARVTLAVGPTAASWDVGTSFGAQPQPDGVNPLMVVNLQPVSPTGGDSADRFMGNGNFATFTRVPSPGFSIREWHREADGSSSFPVSVEFYGPGASMPVYGQVYPDAVSVAGIASWPSPFPAVGANVSFLADCKPGSGQFTVYDAVADAALGWAVFDADFTLLCAPGQASETTIRGFIRIGTARPIAYPVDLVPARFQVQPDYSEAVPGTYVVSASFRPDSYYSPTAVSVLDGEYSIDEGPFTAEPGTIRPGQSLRLRVQAPAQSLEWRRATITVGGVSGTMNVQSRYVDPVPDPFSIPTRTGVAPGVLVQSAPIVITGIDNARVEVFGVYGSTFSVGCTGVYTATPVDIGNNTAICVQHMSSSRAHGESRTTLSVGPVSATFTSVTRPTVAGDSDGDWRADLVWREAAGGLSWWAMNGAEVLGGNYFTVDPAWTIAAAADFDGDGKSDLLWRRAADGALYLWRLDGFVPVSGNFLGTVPAEFSVAGAADLDGDGRADILWRHDDGTAYYWRMYGSAILSWGVLTGDFGPEWVITDLADVDGDGTADVVLRRAGDGMVALWRIQGFSVTATTLVGAVDPVAWRLVAAADFDGDGQADLLWRSTSGDVVVWLLDNGVYADAAFVGNPGTEWSIRSVADFDGDGKADLIWRHADGTTIFWKMDGMRVAASRPVPSLGGSWQVVAP